MINIIDRIIVSESGDGMDSCRAHGIVDCFDNFALGWQNKSSRVFQLQNFDGTYSGDVVRHPTQTKLGANNPNNLSRDQLMCWSAGMHSLDWTEDLIPVIAKLKKPLPFIWLARNCERDYPGTTKRPWPHKMTGGDPVDEGKWRMFDFADPLLPHHILHLYRCAKIKPPLWIKWLGTAFFWLSIRFVSQKIDAEQNQMQCMVKVAGDYWINLYMKHNPMWEKQTKYYWLDERNCPEFYNLILNKLPPPDKLESDGGKN